MVKWYTCSSSFVSLVFDCELGYCVEGFVSFYFNVRLRAYDFSFIRFLKRTKVTKKGVAWYYSQYMKCNRVFGKGMVNETNEFSCH